MKLLIAISALLLTVSCASPPAPPPAPALADQWRAAMRSSGYGPMYTNQEIDELGIIVCAVAVVSHTVDEFLNHLYFILAPTEAAYYAAGVAARVYCPHEADRLLATPPTAW